MHGVDYKPLNNKKPITVILRVQVRIGENEDAQKAAIAIQAAASSALDSQFDSYRTFMDWLNGWDY